MRYRGQGHEIDVSLPIERFAAGDEAVLLSAFDRTYRSLYTRVIPGMVAEALTWRVRVSTIVPAPEEVTEPVPRPITAARTERVLDADDGWLAFGVVRRSELSPGDTVAGPVLVVEDQTTTVVSPRFDVTVDGRQQLVLTRKPAAFGGAAHFDTATSGEL
jgi:N-methylhydantoinase A